MHLKSATIAAVLCVASTASAQTPLDVYDPEPRAVYVQVENSQDDTVVGQSFAPPVHATYSVNGNIGTLLLSKQSHKQLRLWLSANSNEDSFSPLVFEFDLTTLEVTSQPANGAWSWSAGSLSYIQNPLSTDSAGGFTQWADFCTSQAEVDQLCNTNPIYCGAICTVVDGEPYDPSSGLMNLVGSEDVTLCAGFACIEVLEFSRHGDLLVTEIVEASGLPNRPAAVIPVVAIVALVAGVVLFRMRHRAILRFTSDFDA